MIARSPQYLLYAESCAELAPGHWRFVLREPAGLASQGAAGQVLLEVTDAEPGATDERAELLAVVLGLEALDEPAQVTLVTTSSYVRRGLSYGLAAWRESGWTWESFGRMVPIKHRDLWQRLDRALDFHEVRCRHWRIDAPHQPATPAPAALALGVEATDSSDAATCRRAPGSASTHLPKSNSRRWHRRHLAARRWLGDRAAGARLGLAQLGTRLLNEPWLG